MILYFDSYITDIPLNKKFVSGNDALRKSCKNYAMPRKVDIAKYSLASYANYNWSHVLIRYELGDPNEYESFDKYILNLFPKAVIMHERSDSQADYRKSLQILDSWDDEWIFYSANNDHPMVTNDISTLDKMIEKAESFKSRYKYISIIYSHFSEFINFANKKTPFNWRFGDDIEVIEESDIATTIVKHNGENSSILIVNKNLMRYWFDSKNLGDARIIRSESIRNHFLTHDQLVIIPKKEICAHFDGYAHTHNNIIEIRQYQVPPLFIPPGFFENKIKISYGHKQYREGWTNINPKAKYYSFEDIKIGTDLKITLDDLPLFWKNKISEIDTNKDVRDLKIYRDKNEKIRLNPYSIFNKRFNFDTLMYTARICKFLIKKVI